MTTGIEWTDETWNPIAGCSVLSPGCAHCYAMRQAWRMHHQPKYQGTVRKTESGRAVWTGKINVDSEAMTLPLRWHKPRRVFVNSMSDLFHESVPFEVVDLVDVVPVPPGVQAAAHLDNAWAAGPYCWMLERPRLLPEPVPCKGALGLWTPRLDVLDRIMGMMGGAS